MAGFIARPDVTSLDHKRRLSTPLVAFEGVMRAWSRIQYRRRLSRAW